MIGCLTSPDLEIYAIALREKVNHSWLDHEFALVSPEAAVERWTLHEWEARLPYASLREKAHELGRSLMQFSASSLVDCLPCLKRLPVRTRGILAAKLEEMHLQLFDVSTIAREYHDRLLGLEAEIDRFSQLVFGGSAREAEVRDAWASVRKCAAALKQLFVDEKIPRGIVLP